MTLRSLPFPPAAGDPVSAGQVAPDELLPVCRLDLIAAPHVNVLTVTGTVDRRTVHRLQAALRRLADLLRPTVLNLQPVTGIDETALRALLDAAAERHRDEQPPILLRSASEPVRAVLATAGVSAAGLGLEVDRDLALLGADRGLRSAG